MAIISGGQSDFFGLDIGTADLRVVKLKGSGPTKTLERFGSIPIDPHIAAANQIFDKHGFSLAIQQLVSKVGIKTKNVAVNIPTQFVFTTVVDMPKMAHDELQKTIGFQAASFIPTPPEKTKIDWAELGDSKETGKVEVLITSSPNEFIEARMRLVEAAGLNVIAMEPDGMAIARSMISADAPLPQLLLDVGMTSSDLVITKDGAPHLARPLPAGLQNFVRAASQNLVVDSAQAQQFVLKFGMAQDKLDGKVYNSIVNVVDGLLSEVDKSIKFFAQRYGGIKMERIIVTGAASIVPDLPLYIANKFGINVEIGNAWRNVSVPANMQSQAMSVSSHFGVAVGLAERSR